MKIEKTTKLTNYSQFEKIVAKDPKEELKEKLKERDEYLEYIKVHDKEAYKNYLSYSTYLKV
ncbi:MAG: hypothetical protein Q9M34_02425 [Sulfurimonas sp.]|nr:hypothetical protein [Sulfurimonas sp.]